MANINAQRQASDDLYAQQMRGIEEAKKMEDKRHQARLQQIMTEFAIQAMLVEGLSPEEVARRMNQAATALAEIQNQAAKLTTQLLEDGNEAARKAWAEREAEIARIMAGNITPYTATGPGVGGMIGGGGIGSSSSSGGALLIPWADPGAPGLPGLPGTGESAPPGGGYSAGGYSQGGGFGMGDITLINYGTIEVGGPVAGEFEANVLPVFQGAP